MSTVDVEGNWKCHKVANTEDEDADATFMAHDEARVNDTVVTCPVVKEETSEKARLCHKGQLQQPSKQGNQRIPSCQDPW